MNTTMPDTPHIKRFEEYADESFWPAIPGQVFGQIRAFMALHFFLRSK